MQVGSMQGLFDISVVGAFSKYSGYYMDRAGNLYSTRRTKNPLKMLGAPVNGRRMYTLSLTPAHQTRWRKADTFYSTQLMSMCKNHPNFNAETEVGSTAPSPAHIPKASTGVLEPIVARSHAESTAEGIKQRGYIIGRVEGDALVFGSRPVIHTSLASVKSEVERLANKSPGKQIVYLEIKGSARAASLVWE